MNIILNGAEIGNVSFQDSNIGRYSFEIKKDLAGYDRLAVIKINYNSI